MGPGWIVEGALSVPGMRGRFGSEHGPVGGRCCGRVGAKCDEGAGCAIVDVGLGDGGGGSRLPDMTVSAGMTRKKSVGE